MKVRTPRFCNFLLFLILCLFDPRRPVAADQGPAPDRIVSLAPSITESLFAIGAGERVVGVTDHDVFPEEVKVIPSVGGYYDPSLERILALSPQLVIGIATFHGKLLERLETLGVDTLPLTIHRGLDGVRECIFSMGSRLNRENEAREVLEGIEKDLKEVREEVTRAFPDGPPTLLVVVWHDPLTVAGGVNYIDDIMKIIGIPNAASDIRYTFPRMDPEGIVSRDPDIILVPRTERGMSLPPELLMETLKGFPISAVRSGRVASVHADLLFHPGPRVAEAAKSLLEAAVSLGGGEK
ncbi:MAG: ABC transporter substrate-binding protein [Synergistales bacterium]|nr:ABC transporter substrate-binding protein [Synergistales bacterium]